MSSFRRPRSATTSRQLLETLEARQLLAGDAVAAVASGLVAVQAGQNSVSTALLTGMTLHAEAGQPFQAVIADIHNPSAVSAAFVLKGSIDWGDGIVSPALFVHQPDGTTAVVGSHTYAGAGTDDIQIVVTAFPPSGSLAAVRLVGTVHSKAQVIAPDGGVTLSETVGLHFTATLGFIRANAALPAMTAVIDWGDGSVSTGTVVATPLADPLAGGSYVITADHSYAAIGSYAVHITILPIHALPVIPVASTTSITPLALIDSVINVLPILPSIV